MFGTKENKNGDVSAKNSANITLLGELGRISGKGMQSLIDVIAKIKREIFLKELTALLEKYGKLIKDISLEAQKLDTQIKDIGTIGRLSSKIGLELNTLSDSSEERIAQLLIEDMTEDMTETVRLLRDHENGACSEQALRLARELATLHEDAISSIKKFL